MRSKNSSMCQNREDDSSWVRLRIPVVKGFDADSIFSFFTTRIIKGSELSLKHEYRRVLEIDQQWILLAVIYDQKRACLWIDFKSVAEELADHNNSTLKLIPRIFSLVKQVFDVEANSQTILSHLKNSPEFYQQLMDREQNGLKDIRLPAAFDPFEAAMRAIVGQQVSVKAACTLLTRLSERCGKKIATNSWGLMRGLPDAQGIVDHDLGGLGLTGARIDSLKAMAQLRIDQPEVFTLNYDTDKRRETLLAMKGIGPWTVSYLEMRAFSNPDAFPAGDLGVRIALEKDGNRPTEKHVRELSKPWAPWRAYATVLLWQRLS